MLGVPFPFWCVPLPFGLRFFFGGFAWVRFLGFPVLPFQVGWRVRVLPLLRWLRLAVGRGGLLLLRVVSRWAGVAGGFASVPPPLRVVPLVGSRFGRVVGSSRSLSFSLAGVLVLRRRWASPRRRSVLLALPLAQISINVAGGWASARLPFFLEVVLWVVALVVVLVVGSVFPSFPFLLRWVRCWWRWLGLLVCRLCLRRCAVFRPVVQFRQVSGCSCCVACWVCSPSGDTAQAPRPPPLLFLAVFHRRPRLRFARAALAPVDLFVAFCSGMLDKISRFFLYFIGLKSCNCSFFH